MPFDRPTLSELVARVGADIRSRLSISGAIVRRAVANILATVWAGAVHGLYGFLDWLSRQLFVDTSERAFLLRQGSLYGLTPTAATFASGALTATGTDTTVIPEGTLYVRDDGATYTTTAQATIGDTVSGEATVPVTADLAGLSGNMETGDALDLQSPIGGVDTSATVDAPGLDGGNDEEDTEDFRTRVLLRLRRPPQGGSEQDYIAWALAVAGVTRVWVYALENGPGTVVVRFVRDGDTPIIPSPSEVADVQAAIDAQRPVTAEATVLAPVDLPVDFTLSITPDTTALRTAVDAELAAFFARESEAGDGAGRGTILLSAIFTTIGNTPGIDDYTVTVPAADVVPSVGELPTKGTITWV